MLDAFRHLDPDSKFQVSLVATVAVIAAILYIQDHWPRTWPRL